MNYSAGKLSHFFEKLVIKRLTPTETDPNVSNGHEYQGVRDFLEVFGRPKREEKIYLDFTFLYLSDKEENLKKDRGQLSCYDCRWNQPARAPEYRVYYRDNDVTKLAKADDYLILARKKDATLWAIVVDQESHLLSDLIFLFNIKQGKESLRFNEVPQDTLKTKEVPPSLAYLLASMGIDLQDDRDILGEMLAKFGPQFPPTREFSEFARSVSNYTDAGQANADDVIIDWYYTEEYLFNVLEKHLISERLKGSNFDSDSLLEYAKSVLNRRKARAGQSLENHLASLFTARGVSFSRAAVTEGKSRPDFLFPGIAAYKNATIPGDWLHMLGVKTTCKDRWRQVLVEADRIKRKHLLTLEPAISCAQTDEMVRHQLQLVVPKSIHRSYSQKQRAWLIDVEGFIAEVAKTQVLFSRAGKER